MIDKTTTWIVATSFLIAAAGFLWPFWPLSVVGIAICALSGRWLFAVAIGILLDVGYGAPVGPYLALYMPFTLCALLCIAGQMFAAHFMLRRTGDTLQ